MRGCDRALGAKEGELGRVHQRVVQRLVVARLVLPVQKMITLAQKFYRGLIAFATKLHFPFLLLIRLYWGWQFFLTGKGNSWIWKSRRNFFKVSGFLFRTRKRCWPERPNVSAAAATGRPLLPPHFHSSNDIAVPLRTSPPISMQ